LNLFAGAGGNGKRNYHYRLWMKRGWMVIVDIGLGLGLVMWNYARFTIE
jgi:hypothetical protein